MAPTDCMAPKTGKGIMLVLTVPGQWTRARQKGQDLRCGDQVARGVSVGISESLCRCFGAREECSPIAGVGMEE